MSTNPVVTQQPSLLDKINAAEPHIASTLKIFLPAAQSAIDQGVSATPVIEGLVQLCLGIFKHHVTK